MLHAIAARGGLQRKLLAPITSGVPLPVVIVSPSLLCITETPVSCDKLLNQFVALILDRASISVQPR
jgi:hypothetical protein